MTPLFFVSYASSDRDGYLAQFIRDLTDEVRRKLGDKRDDHIRFWDTDDVDMGDVWPTRLADALRTSKLFLCLLSPAYFNSGYCGKEFEVFRTRLAMVKLPGRQRAIFPLLWEIPRSPLPAAVEPFQYSNEDFPPIYAKEGLRYLMKLSKHRDDYMIFVDRLATKLVVAGDANPPPVPESINSFSEIPSAFQTSLVDTSNSSDGGPNKVSFVFVAGSTAELETISGRITGCSHQGGWYWQPYFPIAGVSAGKLAQLAATQLDFRYSELSVDDDLIERIKKAEERNEIVIIIADPWTMCLSQYARLMRQYDSVALVNCSVLLPWNDQDPETLKQKGDLQKAIAQVFARKLILRPPAHEWESIRSVDELNAKLSEVLERLRMMVLQLGTVGRRAESTRIVEQAREAGLSIKEKPTLNTSGAES